MHEHALEGSDGLAYAQMGRFVSAADPESAAGTSDEAAALKDENGNPVSNSARNTWVTATALSTALNMSYMAEQMALFGIVVGIALLLSGIGFIILAAVHFAAASRRPGEGERRSQAKPRHGLLNLNSCPRVEGGSGRPRRFLTKRKETAWLHNATPPAPVETESAVFAKVAALLLGILVAVLGFLALLMWADARESRDAAAAGERSAARARATTTSRCR